MKENVSVCTDVTNVVRVSEILRCTFLNTRWNNI